MTQLTRHAAGGGGGNDDPPCAIRAPPSWDELWAPLLERFVRPGGRASEQQAPPQPQPTPAVPLGHQLSTSRLPTRDELVVRNGRVTGTNHTATELNKSQRRVNILESIAKMPPHAPAVQRGKLYFVATDPGCGARRSLLTAYHSRRVSRLPYPLIRFRPRAKIAGEGCYAVGLAMADADGAENDEKAIPVLWWTRTNATEDRWSDTASFMKAADMNDPKKQWRSDEERDRFLPIEVLVSQTSTPAKPRLQKRTVELMREWCRLKNLLQPPPPGQEASTANSGATEHSGSESEPGSDASEGEDGTDVSEHDSSVSSEEPSLGGGRGSRSRSGAGRGKSTGRGRDAPAAAAVGSKDGGTTRKGAEAAHPDVPLSRGRGARGAGRVGGRGGSGSVAAGRSRGRNATGATPNHADAQPAPASAAPRKQPARSSRAERAVCEDSSGDEC